MIRALRTLQPIEAMTFICQLGCVHYCALKDLREKYLWSRFKVLRSKRLKDIAVNNFRATFHLTLKRTNFVFGTEYDSLNMFCRRCHQRAFNYWDELTRSLTTNALFACLSENEFLVVIVDFFVCLLGGGGSRKSARMQVKHMRWFPSPCIVIMIASEWCS